MNVEELIQKLSPGAVIELYEFDVSPITKTNTLDDHYYFHNGLNELQGSVVWQGNTYNSLSMKAEGFETSTKGALPRPTVTASNATGAMTALAVQYDNLVGAKFIRRQTFLRYLDAVNFTSGTNAEANPNQHLPDDIFYIERKILETYEEFSWELTSALELGGVQLPSRVVVQNYCQWQYRRWNPTLGVFDYSDGADGLDSVDCPYTGEGYFDVNDKVRINPSQDVCSKSLQGCKLRFGARALLPFGAFPASRAYRL